ncbi:MAG: hypothetical protein HUU35_09860 [Armatimonadetes bacterium]|nr:hypothetical protein [Armatimonadota bacterium]
MTDLGELRKTLTVPAERYTALLLLGHAAVLVWTLLLLIGRMSFPSYFISVVLIKAIIALKILPASSRKVELHERGLRVEEFGGLRTVAFEQLEAYYLAAFPRLLPLPGEGRVARHLRLDGGGVMVTIPDDLVGFDELLERVVEAVDRHVAPGIEERYEAGEVVGFGPVRVGREQGLEVPDYLAQFTGKRSGGAQRRTLRWLEVAPAEIKAGLLRLGKTGLVPLGLVPNLHLLAALLSRQGVQISGLEAILGGADDMAAPATVQ